ncbi:DMT family transporter [Chitinimonas lacunae]|uniref:DMT family transporter n=1 Tax=Chitinimonas lacunae TaxID=1963018 RepID=A0ABV8MRX1_9NEIS
MPTWLAYSAVVFVWSTTALAINWSVAGMSFQAALAGRMTLGALLAALVYLALRRPFPRDGAACRAYLVAGLALVSSMLCTYWGARHISSGLLAVIYGLAPLLTALFAALLLGERPSRGQLIGLALGVIGLATIFRSRLSFGPDAHLGIGAALAGNAIQALGAVLSKKYGAATPPFATAVGALAVAAVVALAAWAVGDGQWPAQAGARHWGAVVYLAVVGSVLAMSLYYLLIQRLPTAHVALIMLITPMSSLWLGHVANAEPVSSTLLAGTALILGGLLVHQLPLWRRLRRQQ